MMENNAFVVINGLLGLKRDIILKLIKIIKDIKKVKSIVGLCSQTFEWKNHWFFLKIRRETLGVGLYMGHSEKLSLCEEYKEKLRNFQRRVIEERADYEDGEFFGIFGMVPVSDVEEKSCEILNAIHSVLLVMFKMVVEVYACKSFLFKKDKFLESMIFYWLSRCIKGYKIAQTKEKLFTIILLLAGKCDHELAGEVVEMLPSIMELNKDVNEKNIAVISAVQTAALNENNRKKLIDAGAVSCLYKLKHPAACSCITTMCETSSIEYKNKIVNTPGYLKSIAGCLSVVLNSGYQGSEGNAVAGLALCCFDSNAGGINEEARRKCNDHHIPSLLLQILAKHAVNVGRETCAGMESFALCLVSSVSSTHPSFPRNIEKKAAETSKKLCGYEQMNKYVFKILGALIHACGDAVVGKITTPPCLQLLMNKLINKLMDCINHNFGGKEGVFVLRRVCEHFATNLNAAANALTAFPGVEDLLTNLLKKERELKEEQKGAKEDLKLNLGKAWKKKGRLIVQHCKEVRDGLWACACHLMRGQQDLTAEEHGPMLQHAKAKIEEKAEGWCQSMWDGLVEAEEVLSEYLESKTDNEDDDDDSEEVENEGENTEGDSEDVEEEDEDGEEDGEDVEEDGSNKSGDDGEGENGGDRKVESDDDSDDDEDDSYEEDLGESL